MAATFNLVMLGSPAAGKTAIAKQLSPGYASTDIDPVTRDSCRAEFSVDSLPCVLEVIDDAEREEYPELRDHWIREADGFLLVYSVTSRETFEKLAFYPSIIVRARGGVGAPVVLVGNDCDLISEREVAREEGVEMARKFGCDFVECSARTCANIQRPFFKLVRAIREEKQRMPPAISAAKGVVNDDTL
ncbi:P-loop containing nucleoside triphosphate hydrolase protein [Endogone sp. FLAS-F59071]|nr:P-loop containing nucleoside triphosphate hydrolase protein [Endogone sp. FLAS-F59071]|eukprot:RUS18900.1 P-loop containing nucleoside triphosphate hydrolase protein [Endogone sp. FLAS-F59071]